MFGRPDWPLLLPLRLPVVRLAGKLDPPPSAGFAVGVGRVVLTDVLEDSRDGSDFLPHR